MHRTLSTGAVRAAALVLAALLCAACGGVKIKPDPGLPRALVQPLPARVGLVLDADLRRYLHEETRGGSRWRVDLGSGHEELFRTMLEASFDSVQVFNDPAGAVGATGMQAVFRPQIEQFSFATDQETGGGYWAVTIRYRIVITAPGGEQIDALTLTGYGSTRGGRSANALTRATRSAMRDAASKFLVQMPRQPLAQKLLSGEALTAADAAGGEIDADMIETVPIEAEPD